MLADYAQKNKYNIVGFFGGTYESAKTDGRKEFQRMLDFAKAKNNNVSFIIVSCLDRFSRTGGEAIMIAAKLRSMGITIISITQPTDTETSSGIFQQNIQFLFSWYDNDVRKEKVLAGMKEKLKAGYWMGRAPSGYDNSYAQGERTLVINEKGMIIRKAFELKLNERLNNYQISKKFAALGFDINEKRWYEIFKNPFYCGFIKHRLLGDEIVKGQHEAIVSEDVFLKVNNCESNHTSNYISKPTDELFPLRRFVSCGKCNTTWVGYTVKNKIATYYKCNKRGCKCNRNADKMHQEFKDYISTFSIPVPLIEPLKLQLTLTFKEMNHENENNRNQLAIKLNEVESNLYTIQERFAFGKIDEAVYEKVKQKIMVEKGVIQDEMKKVDSKLSNLDNFVNYTVKLSSKLNVFWGSASFEVKQNLQSLIFPNGIIYDSENNNYRTSKINSVFSLISIVAGVADKKISGTNSFWTNNSALVAGTGIEPVFAP